jgi:hypothetical protein
LGQAILVAGIGVGDVGLGFLEFGLTEFNDRAKTESIAGLREVESQASLLAQLPSYRKTLESASGVLPGSPHVARNVVSDGGESFPIDFGL